jgi:methylmalonyl-CoA/ethylmalonyl-CoA epimerase
MTFKANRVGQIAISVSDVDAAEAFYRDALGLRHLYRFGELTFFDCCGLRLMIEKGRTAEDIRSASPIYFQCADIALAVRELEMRGVAFNSSPHLISRMEDHDLWMAFFEDPDGHVLALMQEAPKDYAPK